MKNIFLFYFLILYYAIASQHDASSVFNGTTKRNRIVTFVGLPNGEISSHVVARRSSRISPVVEKPLFEQRVSPVVEKPSFEQRVSPVVGKPFFEQRVSPVVEKPSFEQRVSPVVGKPFFEQRVSPVVEESSCKHDILSNSETEAGSIISSAYLPNAFLLSNQKPLNHNLDDKKNINKDMALSNLSSFDTDK